MADVITDGVAVFRRSVDRWAKSPNPIDAHHALKAAPAVLQALDDARADIEKRKRGGEELGKRFVFLAELIKDTYRRSADDPIAACQMLGDHLAHLFEDEGGLSVDDHNRVCRALEDRRRELDEVENLRAEVKRLETAAMVRAASTGTEAGR
jgi:hypothetical protein